MSGWDIGYDVESAKAGDDRPKDWTPSSVVVLVCAITVAAGGYVGLLLWQPVVAGLLTTHVGFALVVSLVRTRNLAAELEAVRARLESYNASDVREVMAAEGPVTPPRGQAEVGPIEVEPFMAASGYTPPVLRCPAASCNTVLDRVGPDSLWCPGCETWWDPPEPGDAVNRDRSEDATGGAVDPMDFVGLRPPPHAGPPPMTGQRDTDAQDRELGEIYGVVLPEAVHRYAEDDRSFGPRSVPGRRID